MATVKRWVILEALKASLETIKKGIAVGGVSSEVYSNTAGFVGYGSIDVADFANAEFPAILIVPDLPTNYTSEADGYSYSATWPVMLVMIVKDGAKPSKRNNRIPEMLESFFRDVDLAMHRDENLYPSADVGVELQSFDPEPLAESEFGMAVATYQIKYEQMAF